MSQSQACLQSSPGGHEFEMQRTNLHNHGEVQKGKTQLKVDRWGRIFSSSCKFTSTVLATVGDISYGSCLQEAGSWECQTRETAREESSTLCDQGLWIIKFRERERSALHRRLKKDKMKALGLK